MTKIDISTIASTPDTYSPVEIVERKGIGHPDTICDALAEMLSQELCKYYLERFGLVLHHNVDKALLWGGSSRPAFNGGEIVAPMEIFLAGRATCEFKGIKVPIEDIVRDCCNQWLNDHLHALDVKRHIRIHSLIRPGSADMVDLFLRQEETGVALANDTSCGVAYAPLSELERLVLQTEKHLNSTGIKAAYPEIGEDIKVMGVCRHGKIELTIACAMVDRYVTSVNDYMLKKTQLRMLAKEEARKVSNKEIEVSINTADNPETGSLYLTVSGTSAESGDDGEVGRGNRANGLITPYRPMNMEAVAGKNPVTHIGKLYNIVARQITETLVEEFGEISDAYCYLLSQIGSPVSEPRVIDLKLKLQQGADINALKFDVEEIVHDRLSNISKIRKQILAGLVRVY